MEREPRLRKSGLMSSSTIEGPVLKGEDYSSIKTDAVPISYRIPYTGTMQKLEVYKGEKQIFASDLNFCNSNGACDSTETYQTCPRDCPLDKKDTVCAAVKDSVCDPDCLPGVDPDCKTTNSDRRNPVEKFNPGKCSNYPVCGRCCCRLCCYDEKKIISFLLRICTGFSPGNLNRLALVGKHYLCLIVLARMFVITGLVPLRSGVLRTASPV